ncbi:MAG: decarboxylating 6-phosphogluconate dehydrogenase [Saprospiraceae bacterium]|nr:decarboxylating 6-phosphogluconate dehydrogenase [Saprospiraceae bacterium]
MQLALFGLGKMGYQIALNLRNHGHEVVAFDPSLELRTKIAEEGGILTADSPAEACAALRGRRVIWLMVPAGNIVDEVIQTITPFLQVGDIIIDGGNSNFKDSIRRNRSLEAAGIKLLDCGTSGGTSGALNGACTMIGGDQEAYSYCKPVFDDISLPGGSLFVGASGAGHYVKMVHNGIEYGMMQAIAEGFEVLEKSEYDFDFQQIAALWNHGSVVRSWLMELCENAFSKDPKLSAIRGTMHSSGEGKWTLETALDLGVPTPVIALSLLMRYRSLQDDTFSGKVVAALRNEFGGHAVDKVKA